MGGPESCFDLSRRQQGIDLARAVERIDPFAPADVDLADENLRKSRTRSGTIPHFLTKRRIDSNIVLAERGLFAHQQRFGCAAVTAARAGVDFDASRHVALNFEKNTRLYGSFMGVYNPGAHYDVHRSRFGAQQRPR